MPTVIPVSLSLLASQVLRVISLYPPIPVFPNSFDNFGNPIFETPSQYIRDNSITSFGFPHSIDSSFALVDIEGVYSIPANAYSFVLPSFVSDKKPNSITDTYSVLLIDVDVALIEPGISRLRIDYLDINNNLITDYLDMPFYPKWDTHPREIEEIRQYTEEAVAFLQKEIYVLEEDILHVLHRMQTRGFHVSGQVLATEATNTMPYATAQSHNFQPSEILDYKFSDLKIIEEAERANERQLLQAKDVFVYAIASYPTNVYAQESFQVIMNQSINAGDTLAINGYPLICTIVGNTFTTTLPLAANFNYTFQLTVVNKGKVLTSSLPLVVTAFPTITSVINTNNADFAIIGGMVQVTGRNFGASGTISLGTTNIEIYSWTNSLIIFYVPENVSSGFFTLTNYDGKIVNFRLNIAPANYTDTFVITPITDIINFGQTINYQALYNNNEVTANWSLEDSTGNLGNGNLSTGFLDNSGNYTAPTNSTQSFNISIVGNYVNKNNKYYAKASLIVANNSSTLTISPSSVILEPSFTTLFEVFENGTKVNDVEYFVNGILNGNDKVGKIGADGIYLAPSVVPPNQTLHLDATYNNQTITALIRIEPVDSIINTDVSHDLVEAKTPTNLLDITWYRTKAVQPCTASNSYYTAPGALTLTGINNEIHFFNLTTIDDNGEGNAGTPYTYLYMAQAKDASGKDCIVSIIGQDFNYSSGEQQQTGLTSQLQISCVGGSLSNNVTVNKAGFQYITSANYAQNTINQLDSIATSAEIDIQFNPKNVTGFNGTELLQATKTTSLTGYYFSNRGFILRAFPLTQSNINGVQVGTPHPDNAYANGYSPLPDALYDLIDTGNGNYFYRMVFYPANGIDSINVDYVHNFSTDFNEIIGIGGTQPILTGVVVAAHVPNTSFSTLNLNIAPKSLPIPQINSITSACPNNVVNIYGTNFTSDSQAYFVTSNQVLPRTGPPSTTDGINYVLSVTVPNSISQNTASYPVYITGSTGDSNKNVSLVIPTNCIVYPLLLTITPTNSTLLINKTEQFSATLQKTDGTTVDVTDNVVWYTDNNPGGNGQYGFINNEGLYFAPSAVPVNNPVSVSATYTYMGQPLTANTSVTIKAPFAGPPPPAPPSIHHGCYMLTVSPNTTIIDVPGNPVQFSAYLWIDDANPQPVYAQWLVNGIPGGDGAFGTIDSSGLYTPPSSGYPPLDSPYIKVEASYTTTPVAPDTTPITLMGYSVVGFAPHIVTSGSCLLTVTQQINVFFGDGRCGYIPVGTTITLQPGQYAVATYAEELNTCLIPFDDNSGDQLIPLSLLATQANNLSYTLYNEGTLVQIAGNNEIENFNNIYSQPYTVVLGVCDPNEGKFQSMWDLIPVVLTSGMNGLIPTQPNTCIVSHNLELRETELNESKSVIDLIDEKVHDVGELKTTNKFQEFWTGKLEFDNSNVKILEEIKFFKYNMNENSYEVLFSQSEGNWNITNNQILYFNAEIKSIEVIDKNQMNSNNYYVLAFTLDKLYTAWPYVQILDSKESIKTNDNGINIGNMFIKWGTNAVPVSDNDKTFVQTESSHGIKDLKNGNFSYNDDTKKLPWLAFGSLEE